MKISAIGRTGRHSAIVAALAVTIPACGPASDDGAAPSVPRIESSRALGATRGPNGEHPTPNSALRLSSSEVAKVRAGRYTAALVWHEGSDFTGAVDAGVRDEFSVLGIRVVAETSANFDAAKQKADVETVQAKRPSVLLTLPVDPVVTASAYQAAARQGTKIVLLSSVPQGMTYGRDYVNLVTDDLFQMGKRAADALAAILYTGRLQGASYTLGEQDLLTVIAAVVIGGTRLFGGEGSVIGALVGSLLMGMLTNGLILWGLTSSEQLIAQGVLLLLAISLTLRGRRGR